MSKRVLWWVAGAAVCAVAGIVTSSALASESILPPPDPEDLIESLDCGGDDYMLSSMTYPASPEDPETRDPAGVVLGMQQDGILFTSMTGTHIDDSEVDGDVALVFIRLNNVMDARAVVSLENTEYGWFVTGAAECVD